VALLRQGILGRLSPPFKDDEEPSNDPFAIIEEEEPSRVAFVGLVSALKGRLPERSRSRDGGFGAGTLAAGAGLTDLSGGLIALLDGLTSCSVE
jgi:hypothetical protein